MFLKMVKFCKHLFFFLCRFASRVRPNCCVKRLERNILFGDRLCETTAVLQLCSFFCVYVSMYRVKKNCHIELEYFFSQVIFFSFLKLLARVL